MVLRYRTLRRRCHSLLETLDLSRPVTLDELCRRLARHRDRPLHVHPLPTQPVAPGACGVWLATDTDDHIFVEPATSRLHQEHIILHEISHMLLEHDSTDLDPASAASALMPDLSPALVRQLLARTSYDTPQEQEAETLASLMWSTALHSSGPERSTSEGPLGKLEKALGLDGPC
ncbi:hypothetical protein ACFCXS_29745 [Streptomyces sp. NPDC056373]|uniref:hypothetical protein n=1 Tax=Streptomyces sp. NPDC056373 TaxID=3345798 RepID=UPI0035DE3072